MTPTAMIGGVRVRFSLLFPAMLALLCTWKQGELTALCLLAAVMHECGHLAVLLLLRRRPREIRFSAFGMCLLLEHTPMRRSEEALVALGGPLVNLLSALFWALGGGETDWISIHLLLGCFNLLPIWPLDGGQCLPENAIRKTVSAICLSALSAFSVMLVFAGNITLMIVCLYLWSRLYDNG